MTASITVFDPSKYLGLKISRGFEELMQNDPQRIIAVCNGVGSEVGWLGKLTYHLTPNTIWGLDITPASDIHDVDYSHPMAFKSMAGALSHKRAADKRFLDNMETLIRANTENRVLLWMRLHRARAYYDIVSNAGSTSYLKDKVIQAVKRVVSVRPPHRDFFADKVISPDALAPA